MYAGGLGVLAGDVLKQAADDHFPMVGVGLLYRGKYAHQHVAPDGSQTETHDDFDPLSRGLEHVYLNDQPVFIRVHLTQLDIWLRCWQKKISPEVTLYLLDPDTDQNHLNERSICHALYCGTQEEQLKQQFLLGIGGVKLLKKLGIKPRVFHLNEGRPAFLNWQLIRQQMDDTACSYEDAFTWAKNQIVYTNHTLVPAGNQLLNTHLLTAYGEYYAQKMNVSIETLLALGDATTDSEFDLTKFALNTSRAVSSVSEPHLTFCQQRWPSFSWQNVTNGVHLPTWQSPAMATAHTPQEIWHAHLQEKRRTMEYIQQRTGFGYNPEWLVITWARRIAGYKQLPKLIEDLERLAEIIKNTDHPIQLLIAGKAHPYDLAAKKMLQEIIHACQRKLSGHALFIPDLNIELDQYLTRGSDVWLNTPIIGQEASGTSGMKAVSNGVLQCTTLDGWTSEVNWEDRGWVLDGHATAASFYQQLETYIAPLYYSRDSQNMPNEWILRMQRTKELANQYSAKRMLEAYRHKLYDAE